MPKISAHKKAKWYLRYCYHFNLIKYKVCIWIVLSSVCAIQVFFLSRRRHSWVWEPKRPQRAVDEISAVHLWGVAELLILTLLIFYVTKILHENKRERTNSCSFQTNIHRYQYICVLLDDISQPDLIESPLIHLETFGCILLDTYVTLVTVD